jgi:hypothetical protein
MSTTDSLAALLRGWG